MEPYLFWSMAFGENEREDFQRCVESARVVGVPNPFHVMTDGEISGCECYDGMGLDSDNGFRLLAYMKAAISRLAAETYVFIAPSTRFLARPIGLPSLLGLAPLHIPFEEPLVDTDAARVKREYGVPIDVAERVMRRLGVRGRIYFCRPALFIVRRRAIDLIFNLTREFRVNAKKETIEAPAALALAYTMHMLAPDRDAHRAGARPDLWRVGADLELPADGRPLTDWLREEKVNPRAALTICG